MFEKTRTKIPLLIDSTTPCGHECRPLNDEYCLLFGTNDATEAKAVMDAATTPELKLSIAQLVCNGVKRQNILRDISATNFSDAKFWKQVALELSTDKHTGLLTGNSLHMLLDMLYDSGLAAEYSEQGFKIRVLYADVDNLKGHNSGPGKHSQGDLALSAASQKIRNRSGRSMDITALGEDFIDDYDFESSDINSRSNSKGDEFIRISFVDPKNLLRTETIEEELERLKGEFKEITYDYEGIEYSVTLTFGIAEINIPNNASELTACIRAVDLGMMDFKENRVKDVSDGIVVTFG
jgi:GGDEF domain-containing protein